MPEAEVIELLQTSEAEPKKITKLAQPAKAALQEVQKAVSDLHQADFNTADELQEAKAKLNGALLAARAAGASEVDILKSSKPTAFEVDDSATAGVAARRARKLRQLEKELRERDKLQEQQRLERERAGRVAKAAAARREVRAAQKAEKAKRRAEKAAKKRSRTRSRDRRRSSSRSNASRKPLQQPTVHSAVAAGEEISGELVVHHNAADGDDDDDDDEYAFELRMGPGRINDGRTGSPLRFRGSPSRKTGEDAGAITLAPDAYDFVTPRVPLPEEEIVTTAEPEEDTSLTALLGRPSHTTTQASQKPLKPGPLDVSQLPLSMLTGGAAAGIQRFGNYDMSTGGGEVCHNFAMGKCTRWGCKFKHVQR